MTEFIKLKNKIIKILIGEEIDKNTIEKILSDDDIYYAINNHFSAEDVAWAVLY